MNSTGPAAVAAPCDPNGLRIVLTRLRAPEDRPIGCEDEDAEFATVDPGYENAVRNHLAPFLGECRSSYRDTEGPFAIDVAQSEPDEGRSWGACLTLSAIPLPPLAGGAPDASKPPNFELIARLPAASFRYWDGVVLEPFEDEGDALVDVLGELARLPHLQPVRYIAPHVVATPDLSPLSGGLAFAGVLLRAATLAPHPMAPHPMADTAGARETVARPRLRVPTMSFPGRGEVQFLTVTLLHAAEVRGLLGPARAGVLARLEAMGVDDLLAPARASVI